MTPRHLLTVDILGGRWGAALDGGHALQETAIVSSAPGDDAEHSGGASGDCRLQQAALAGRVSSPWQNPEDPLDVDADGSVTARDALLVANRLKVGGAGPLESAPGQTVGHSTDPNEVKEYTVPISGNVDPGALYLQSHWGSGVKFTSARVTRVAAPPP